MEIYKNWSIYTPIPNESNQIFVDLNAIFVKDENGNDWYETVHTLEDGKIYILVSELTNVVLGYSRSASGIFPIDMTLCVCDTVPDGFFENPQNFELDGDKIVPSTVRKSEDLELTIEFEMNWANNEIGTLSDAELFEKPENLPKIQERLLALRRYRYELSQIKPSETPMYQLPQRP